MSTATRSRTTLPQGVEAHVPALRAALHEQRRFRTEQLEEITDAWHDLERADGPRSDVTAVLHAAALKALTDVEAALERMDRSAYGRCLDCQAPIPVERLEVLPMGERCMSCQRRRELRAPASERAVRVPAGQRGA